MLILEIQFVGKLGTDFRAFHCLVNPISSIIGQTLQTSIFFNIPRVFVRTSSKANYEGENLIYFFSPLSLCRIVPNPKNLTKSIQAAQFRLAISNQIDPNSTVQVGYFKVLIVFVSVVINPTCADRPSM